MLQLQIHITVKYNINVLIVEKLLLEFHANVPGRFRKLYSFTTSYNKFI